MTIGKGKKPAPTTPPVSELLPIKGALGKLFAGLNTILGVFRRK